MLRKVMFISASLLGAPLRMLPNSVISAAVMMNL